MSYKSKRSKATNISQKVKEAVWERDFQRCIFCKSPQAMPNAHYISRAYGGLGVEENIVTACIDCHRLLDQSINREVMLKLTKKHLQSHYENWNKEALIYRRY